MDTIFHKLEYNQIIQIIGQYCKTYLGKKLCKNLHPIFQFEEVNALLLEVKQANLIVHQKGAPPLFELNEIEGHLKRLESGQSLSTKGLIDIAKLLTVCRELHSYFFQEQNSDLSSDSYQENFYIESSENFSNIEQYFSDLYSNPSIEKNILDKILDENTIADNASSKLSSLRKSRKSMEQDIKDKLNHLIHSSTYSKYLMDPIITIRNSRYVIPVKEEYRDKISGLIHDTSSSGSTLYIEPTNIFEMNNKINHLRLEEEVEIEKILQALSSSLFPYITELTNNLKLVGYIDLLFAKVQYGKTTNSIEPQLNKNKLVQLVQARHPLISAEQVVPIDISLGQDYTVLLITGPNTGGKTVALKTVGLLLLMAYSGIPIPCSENSSICVFSNIFADIGDEQSIEQSLSTFSAHMKNIVTITNEANSNSLILLDELGSGTDPVEGSRLAISLLEYFKNMGCLAICTTHYKELKEYALVTDGFENASFEFDLENLKPTYKLLIGIPGKSNAFEISQKLGLSENIIVKAKSLIEQDHASMEELLKNIYDDQQTIQKLKEETSKNATQIEQLRKSLEKEKSQLEEKKKEILEKAKTEARELVLDAKDEVTELLKNKNQNLDNVRNQLNDKLKEYATNTHLLENSPTSSYASLPKEEVKKGLEVWIPSLQMDGTILSSQVGKSNEILVQVGQAKMNLKLQALSKMNTQNSNHNTFNSNSSKDIPLSVNHSNHNISNNNTSSKFGSSIASGSVHQFTNTKSQFISSEINVIGENVEDAIYVLDKYIDDCSIAKLSPIRIVHGKGTGKLREGIHQYLKKNPHVKSFRLGTFGEGEMGVTVVELK